MSMGRFLPTPLCHLEQEEKGEPKGSKLMPPPPPPLEPGTHAGPSLGGAISGQFWGGKGPLPKCWSVKWLAVST